MNAQDLYQQIILDHNQYPVCFHQLKQYNRHIEGHNPLCGDRVTLFAQIEDSQIKAASFQGSGCAICVASCSLLMHAIQNKSLIWSQQLFNQFFCMVKGQAYDSAMLGKIEALKGVNQFPVRIKCATLAWHAWQALASNQCNTISTEPTP
jgi:nitrogen fixation protein NifU and related proteins